MPTYVSLVGAGPGRARRAVLDADAATSLSDGSFRALNVPSA
jgi:hypothetical protein